MSSPELPALLAQARPTTLLKKFGPDVTPPLGPYRAEALLALDRLKDAAEYLDPLVAHLENDEFAYAERVWAEVLLRQGFVDNAILAAEGAVRAAQNPALRAAGLAWRALGYAHKQCPHLAETTLKQAQTLAPAEAQPLLGWAEARLWLALDERLAARAAYERLSQIATPWARVTAASGQAQVAWLLGAFDEARELAQEALRQSSEWVEPLFVLGQVALATDDVPGFEVVLLELERRSPKSERLPAWKAELPRFAARVQPQRAVARANARHRLQAFPTTVQRRDYCGPSVIELVLRYWQGAFDLHNDQIAQVVKTPGGGTPPYRIREFFHLVGFETVRCSATPAQLKALLEAGYPAIIQHEYAQSSHVAVVIGYDDTQRPAALELQDPMTHAITAMSVREFEQRRVLFGQSALVAFPAGQGHAEALARLGLFDDPALVWADQAALALDEGQPQTAAALMARATHKEPGLPLAWLLWLTATHMQWENTRQALPPPVPAGSLAAKLVARRPAEVAAARAQFFHVLQQAAAHFPHAEFVHRAAGDAALAEGDAARAIAAYIQACEADPEDAYNYLNLAACYYAQRDFAHALEAAYHARDRHPALPGANVWAALALAAQETCPPAQQRAALHYARCARELAPTWWRTHQAWAQALLTSDLNQYTDSTDNTDFKDLSVLSVSSVYQSQDKFTEARRALETALTLAPHEPELKLLRAQLLWQNGDAVTAMLEVENTLARAERLTPVVDYAALRLQSQMLFNAARYPDAAETLRHLLKKFPEDGWALHLLAVTRAQLGEKKGTLSAKAHAEVQQLFERALQANPAKVLWVARDYVDSLTRLAGPTHGAAAAARLCAAYPDHAALWFLRAQAQQRAGETQAAAHTFLEALARPHGTPTPDERYAAVAHVLRAFGPAAGEQALLTTPTPPESSLAERQRLIGLCLAQDDDDRWHPHARELLQAALRADPADAWATLRLGDVTPAAPDREALYRRALLLNPRWAYARAHLARYLTQHGRAAEALTLTAGHEAESFDLLTAHGVALLYTGRADEAAEIFAQATQQPDGLQSWLCYYQWLAETNCGRHTEALHTAQTSLAAFPEVRLWYLRVATSLRHLERFTESANVIAEGQAQGLQESEMLEADYETAWARQDWPAALEAAERLLALLGEHTGDHHLGQWEARRLRLLLMLGHRETAWDLLHAENLDAPGWGEAAWTAMLAREWALCLELADRALRLDPTNFNGLLARAEALSGLEREPEALAAYETLRVAHPTEHNAYEKLALRLALNNQLDEAYTLADRAVNLGPFCPFAWATRGYVSWLRGQPPSALSDLETAWGRADPERRRHSNEFWWLLALLQKQPALAAARRQAAYADHPNTLTQHLLRLIDERGPSPQKPGV